MSQLVLVAVAYVTALLIMVLVFFIGDPESDSCLGRLTKVATITLPKRTANVVRKLPGGARAVDCCSGSWNYMCYKPNPLLQGVYLVLIVGGFIVFQFEGAPALPNKYLSSVHQYTSHVAIMGTLYTFIRASNNNPGIITRRTIGTHNHFPFDGFMYTKRDCPTCNIPKLARSKHCAICNTCVSKFDHHCPWINSCVGEANYRDFLLFLVATASFLFYGAYVIGWILVDFVEARKLFSRVFVNRSTGQQTPASWSIVLTYMFVEKGLLIMLFVLCAFMGFVVFCFFGYHLTLVMRGVTTNESSKWGSIKSYYSDLAEDRRKHPEQFPPRTEEQERELLNPDTMPSLEKRDVLTEFPLKMPKNIYNLGIFANFGEVLFPPCFYRPAVPYIPGHANVASQATVVAPTKSNGSGTTKSGKKYK